jgi:ankyrin repeat protein
MFVSQALTALMLAAKNGRKEVVKALIEKGVVDVNAKHDLKVRRRLSVSTGQGASDQRIFRTG